MSLTQYSKTVLDHFYHAGHAGKLTGEENIYQVHNTSPSVGAELHLAVRVVQGTITDPCFLCRGGVAAIACCEWVCTKLEDCSLEQGKKLTAQQCQSELEIPSQQFHIVDWVVATAHKLCNKADYRGSE